MSRDAERPLAGQRWLGLEASRRVLDALEADGRPARFVGGCVRDGLLGEADGQVDLDLATPEPPERVQDLLARARIRAVPTGLAHGTITAVIQPYRFEITTLRRDVRTDGRHADVVFTDSFEADAARRDFTINAMSCDRSGRLFDYFGGRDDLARGRIRFVGEAPLRIAEDRLRILRFFRFFARFGRPPPDTEALAACRAQATSLRRLSGERIQAEMLKLLAAARPVPSLALMIEAGVADVVFGGPVALPRLEGLLAVRPDAPRLLRLAALLRPPPAAPVAAAEVAGRWRLSRADARRLVDAATAPAVDPEAPPRLLRRRLYDLGRERVADLASLAAADRGEPARAALEDVLAEAARFEAPELPVGGDDVLAAGVPPGPEVGRILRSLEAWWVGHDFAPDRAACLTRLRALVSPPPDPGGAAAPPHRP